MQQQAQILQKGHEPHLSVVLDMIAPLHWISQSLIAVQNQYPDTTWQVHTEMLDAIAQRVLKRSAQLGITGWLHPSQQRLLASEPLGKVDFVYVVAPQHALARIKPPVPRVELNAYIHLNVTDRSADNPQAPARSQTVANGRSFNPRAFYQGRIWLGFCPCIWSKRIWTRTPGLVGTQQPSALL